MEGQKRFVPKLLNDLIDEGVAGKKISRNDGAVLKRRLRLLHERCPHGVHATDVGKEIIEWLPRQPLVSREDWEVEGYQYKDLKRARSFASKLRDELEVFPDNLPAEYYGHGRSREESVEAQAGHHINHACMGAREALRKAYI